MNADAHARYARHIALPDVGERGQQRLLAGSVAVVGAGGLGSPVLLYLAAAGVGRIGIIDADVVDLTNLQRQVVHATAAIGENKASSAARRLRALNPTLRYDEHPVRLTAVNAREVLAAYDVIVDGCDNFPTRYLVADAAELLGKPVVYGAIGGFEGCASVFLPGGAGYRDLYPEPPPPHLAPSCADNGVLGVLPGVIGSLLATEAIKLLLGVGTPLAGRLLLYDARALRFDEVSVARDPDREPITTLVDYEAFCASPSSSSSSEPAMAIEQLTPPELKKRLDAGWKPYVLDVRRPNEAAVATLAFTDRLQPHDSVLTIAAELPKDRDIVVYCRSGMRSQHACAALAQAGFSRLFNLQGGINGWSATVDPSIPSY